MSDMSTPSPSPRAADLLAGPRGRRLLLEFAVTVGSDALRTAASEVSAALDPHRGRVVRYVRNDGYSNAVDLADSPDADPEDAPREPASPATVAWCLSDLPDPLPDPTPELLRKHLYESVDAASYWCPSDGNDILTADPAVRDALTPVAEHLAAASLTDWWWSAPAPADQWTVTWGEDATPFPDMPPEKRAANLRNWGAHVREDEERSSEFLERRRTAKNAAGGGWWSMPLWKVPTTTRSWPDGSGAGDPVGALFVEDRWDDVFCATRFAPSDYADILEITGADDWAELCCEFPLVVTWSHRRDWWEVTGRDSREAGLWLIPDWSAVAGKWAAVHLTVAGYLAAATRSIPVRATDGRDAASVIAGWGPDVTYWLR